MGKRERGHQLKGGEVLNMNMFRRLDENECN